MNIDTAKIRAAVEASKKAGWPDEGLALVTELCNEIERLRHENGTPLSMLGVGQLRQENDELRRETERLRKDAERQFRDELIKEALIQSMSLLEFAKACNGLTVFDPIALDEALSALHEAMQEDDRVQAYMLAHKERIPHGITGESNET